MGGEALRAAVANAQLAAQKPTAQPVLARLDQHHRSLLRQARECGADGLQTLKVWASWLAEAETLLLTMAASGSHSLPRGRTPPEVVQGTAHVRRLFTQLSQACHDVETEADARGTCKPASSGIQKAALVAGAAGSARTELHASTLFQPCGAAKDAALL